MRAPDLRTMVLGHPWVTAPLTLCGLVGLYVCYLQGSAGAFPGLVIFVLLMVIGRAHSQANAYRRWKGEWDAMGKPAAPVSRKPKGRAGIAVAGLLALAIAVWLEGRGYPAGIVLIVGVPVAALWAIVARVRRRASAKPASAIMPVQVVAQRLMPLPTLPAAYAALPGYCRQLFARPGK